MKLNPVPSTKTWKAPHWFKRHPVSGIFYLEEQDANLIPKRVCWSTREKNCAATALDRAIEMRTLWKSWGGPPSPPSPSVPDELAGIDGLVALQYFVPPCVYFLVHHGHVVYVGQSTGLQNRLFAHMKTKTFDSVFFLPVERNRLLSVEEKYIRALMPKYNRPAWARNDVATVVK